MFELVARGRSPVVVPQKTKCDATNGTQLLINVQSGTLAIRLFQSFGRSSAPMRINASTSRDCRVLRYDEEHTWTCAARRNERGERFRHRSLVVAYENSGLRRRLAQYGFVVETV
jgi:hypothetical protein